MLDYRRLKRFFADNDGDKESEADWNFSTRQCSMGVTSHWDLELNDLEITPGDYIFFDSTNFNENKRTVSTEGSCPYNLYVHVTSTSGPGGVDVLEDFDIDVSSSGGDVDLNGYTNLNGYESSSSPLKIGGVDSSDWSGNLNNVNGTEWVINYRYLMGADDVTGVNYKVKLAYTVSAQ